MKTNDVAFGPVYLSSYLPLKYPSTFQALEAIIMLIGKIIEVNETDTHIFTFFLVADTFMYIIGKFDYKIMFIIIFPDI